MKKILSIFALSILLLGMNACNSDNDDDMTRKIQGDMLTNSVSLEDGTSVKVAKSNTVMVWDMLASKVSVTCNVAVTNSSTANLSLNDVDLMANETYNCYTFSVASAGNGITNVNGYYRPETGCLYIDFIYNGTHRVMCASQLYYPYLKTNITNTETSKVKQNENSAMLIIINSDNMTAKLKMGNFALEESGGLISEMSFNNLDVEATATGYKVTCNEDKSSDDGNYKLNNFEAQISGNCQVVNGTFTLNTKYTGTFNGKAFAN